MVVCVFGELYAPYVRRGDIACYLDMQCSQRWLLLAVAV